MLQLWGHRHLIPHLSFVWMLGVQIQFPVPEQQAISPQNVSPAPKLLFEKAFMTRWLIKQHVKQTNIWAEFWLSWLKILAINDEDLPVKSWLCVPSMNEALIIRENQRMFNCHGQMHANFSLEFSLRWAEALTGPWKFYGLPWHC